jgi:hypothetical protein
MRQPVKAVILGLLFTLFCLLIGGQGCVPRGMDVSTPEQQCKLIVGTQVSTVQVFMCVIDGKCYYVPGRQGGAMLETACVQHMFAEEPK